MAQTNNLTMGYVLKKVTNPTSRVVNRWFAYVDRQGTLSTRGLAEHMIAHGLVGSKGDVRVGHHETGGHLCQQHKGITHNAKNSPLLYY